MRFTLAQTMRWVVYVAVAMALATAFRDVISPDVWVLAIPLYLALVAASWSLVSIVILRGKARRRWVRVWLLVACVLVFAMAAPAGLMWTSALLFRPDEFPLGTLLALIVIWFVVGMIGHVCLVLGAELYAECGYPKLRLSPRLRRLGWRAIVLLRLLVYMGVAAFWAGPLWRELSAGGRWWTAVSFHLLCFCLVSTIISLPLSPARSRAAWFSFWFLATCLAGVLSFLLLLLFFWTNADDTPPTTGSSRIILIAILGSSVVALSLSCLPLFSALRRSLAWAIAMEREALVTEPRLQELR
jgi:hypothetical protein